MSEWKKVKLGEICDYVIDNRGITPTKANTEWKVSGYKVLSAKNIKTGKIVQEDTIRFIDEIAYKRWMKKEVERGDIFVTSEAPFGEIYYWDKDEKIVLGQRLFGLKLKKSLLSKFVYYQMTNYDFQMQMSGKATGTTVIGLRQPELLKCEINLPPLEEQKAIADVLSCLDDKIELNNKINKNLEEQAQALFKRWFVDFEFPNKDGNPYKSSGGEMKDSELGEIPEGWEVNNVNKFFDITIGRTPPRKEPEWFSKNTTDYRWLSISDMGKNELFADQTSEYLTPEAIKKFNVPIVCQNTILLSFKLTIGRVKIAREKMTTNEAIAHFNTRNQNIREYVYFLLKDYDYSLLGNTSSIATAVNSTTIKQMKILHPTGKALGIFHDLVAPFFNSIQKNEEQNQKLAELRDYLLPKLMSGEIQLNKKENIC